MRAMALSTEAVGRTFAPHTYAVGREKIKEFALATGETNPLHLDHRAARAAGYADVVAPPMFTVVYCATAFGEVLFDPEVGVNFARLVHSAQEFKWGPLVVAGDEIETAMSVTSISERAGNAFYRFESVSTNQDGATVAVGIWDAIVRGE